MYQKMKKKLLIILIIIILILAIAPIIWYNINISHVSNKDEEVEIEIELGSTTNSIIEKLKENKIVSDGQKLYKILYKIKQNIKLSSWKISFK